MKTLETSTVHDIYKLKLYVSTIYILHLYSFKISLRTPKGPGVTFFLSKGGGDSAKIGAPKPPEKHGFN